ncbi:MAG: 3-dehydroquinate synthase, partial [Patescibacteria group bacterium]|nr:3-dehydroquinate synthase [Patescibacteria group bacterium]
TGYQDYLDVPQSQIFQAQADEDFKTLEGALKLIDFLQEHNFTKAEKLIVLGGGVIQDVAALVGALYKRGIAWEFFPTTLLAMCDSCIGAKASINYRNTKN